MARRRQIFIFTEIGSFSLIFSDSHLLLRDFSLANLFPQLCINRSQCIGTLFDTLFKLFIELF